MAYSPITPTGEAFITKVCKDGGTGLLTGKYKFSMPYTGPPPNNQIWKCNFVYNGVLVTTGELLAEALIHWFNQYAEQYQLDANVVAAQAFIESGYVMWAYSGGDSAASGVNQFEMLTFFSVVVENQGSSDKMSDDEINKLIFNLTDNKSRNSYDIRSKSYDVPRKNRPLFHQNVIDNPNLMIKAQCRYLKDIANKSDSLASTTLFCYNRGMFMSNTYSKAIQNCERKFSGNKDYLKTGLDYVLKVFGVLGDKNNYLEGKGLAKNYKPSGIYFGYDSNLPDSKGNADPTKNLKLTQGFDAFTANVDESKEFNLDPKFEHDIVAQYLSNNDSNYRYIYYPENKYNQVMTQKKQIVLHHTASGDGSAQDILWWEKHSDKVAVSFIITRAGTILQLFSTDYWAFHLGLTADLLNTYGTVGITKEMLNSSSIGIELDNWGGLVNSAGQWYPPVANSMSTADVSSTPIPITNVIEYNGGSYPNGYHGYYGFERYTSEQITSLKILITAIMQKWSDTIPLDYNANMWGTYNNTTSKWEAIPDAYAEKPGIWTHVSYVPTNSDCQPQPDLVDMLKSLK